MALLLVPVTVAAMATWIPMFSDAPAARLGWEGRLRGPWLTLWGWALAAACGAVYAGFWRTGLRRSTGMALMWVPVARVVLRIVQDYAALASSGQVLRALTEYELSSAYIYSIMRNIGYVGAGFVLWSAWRPSEGLRGLARRLRDSGAPVAGPHGEARSMWLGFLLFPVLLVGAMGTQGALQQVEALVNSDESSIWDRATPWHVVMISAAAAFGEEIVYRLLLMTCLAAILQRMHVPARAAWVGALVGQSVVFGFAHAGYANWLHVIIAGLFGLVAGIAALWLGVWVAIVLHFLVDIYAIGGHVDSPLWIALLLALLVANVGLTVAAGGRWAFLRVRSLRARGSRSRPPG